MQPGKKLFYVFVAVSILVFTAGIYRYAQMPVPSYEGDIRNKITGARLQKDGISPYFYHWQPGADLKYYDYNASRFIPSKSTSTPFQHRLFYLLANLSQKKINLIWFIAENLLFAATIFISLLLSKNNKQKILILIAGILFFFSHSWKANLAEGQSYILIPFLALLLFYFLNKPLNRASGFICGLITVSLILFKPNTILMVLPLAVLVKSFPRTFLKFYFGSIAIIIAINFIQPGEISYWKDYITAVKEHEKIWQTAAAPIYPPVKKINEWEGINVAAQKAAAIKHPINLDNEYSNFFVFYNSYTGNRVPVWALYVLFILSSVVLLFILFKHYVKKYSFPLTQALLCGALLYMLSDFLSPIIRSQYYSIQWLYPLLMIAIFYHPLKKRVYLLLLAGLLLNVISLSFIKWEHTLGEVIIFTTISFILFNPSSIQQTATEAS